MVLRSYRLLSMLLAGSGPEATLASSPHDANVKLSNSETPLHDAAKLGYVSTSVHNNAAGCAHAMPVLCHSSLLGTLCFWPVVVSVSILYE